MRARRSEKVVEPVSEARALFDGIAHRYDAPAAVLSLGQYARWRRILVESLRLYPGALVLDVATGTGAIALDVERRYRCTVVGVDQSEGMLGAARARTAGRRIRLAGGNADRLPFPDERFDTVVFSYLFRYVADPAVTLRELTRVLRPGGMLASVEFGVPRARPTRWGWRAQALHVLPLASRALSPGWRTVGEFLGPNIVEWAERWPIDRQVEAWRAAGIENVAVKTPTFGTAVILTGRKRG